MRKCRIYLLLFFASLILIIFINYQHISTQGIRYEIRVVNGFTNNSSLPLVIWCTSHDGGDIGGRALQEGDDYTWYLRLSFWIPAPAYSCTVKWDRARMRFEAFKVHRDRNRCGMARKCLWLVKEDGIYFINHQSNWIKELSWI
ncbi:hypothetical protein SSX86_008871 [Deinandra increscens subsp. villosa]|uniref:S-protein homolog n=1 Tax=Deinandra increscens subsp. villosa TaxID=3103831 RepID=A0AAP0DGW1_9ASTR